MELLKRAGRGASADLRRARERRGRTSELLAASYLVLRGYRILARRQRTRGGEIDLIAVKGRRLAFVEVKRRGTLEDALASLTARQEARIRRAALDWIARRPRYQSHELTFDAVLLVGWGWPIHLENGL